MIHRQPAFALSAILTGIIVAAKYFAPRQFDMRARSMNLAFKPDDRRAREQLSNGPNVTATVQYHIRLASQQQTDCPSCIAHVDRFKISVQNQYRLVHSGSTTDTIILPNF
jgi:hypothetical protein